MQQETYIDLRFTSENYGVLFDQKDNLMSSLQLFRSVKEVLSANSEATEEHIEKQDKVLNSLGTYFILNVVIIFKNQ